MFSQSCAYSDALPIYIKHDATTMLISKQIT